MFLWKTIDNKIKNRIEEISIFFFFLSKGNIFDFKVKKNEVEEREHVNFHNFLKRKINRKRKRIIRLSYWDM